MEGVDDREFEQYLEKQVTVLLKDNRYLYGIFKSYDQYYSVTLNFTVERIFLENRYAEKRLGLVVVRVENILLIAETRPSLDSLKKVDYLTLAAEIEKIRVEAMGSIKKTVDL